MRLADYVAQRCVDAGATKVFLVTGGGAMHLNDAFGRHTSLTPVCFHHEQAAAMAAESYFRTSNEPVILNVTTGPGGINALNGIFGAYVDSQAMFVISGQVKNETYYKNYNIPLRQLGDQEVDIVSMAKPVVKYAITVYDPKQIREILDKALFLATYGRPGPIWIDIPIDVSSVKINPNDLKYWNGNINELANDPAVTENTQQELLELKQLNYDDQVDQIISRLTNSKRPVIYAGSGIRLSDQYKNFLQLVEKLGVPTVTGWNAHDVLPFDNPCYAGKPGTVGDRPGNFTVQNSDLIIILGCRLNIRQVSYNWKNFANKAYKIMVDIDKAELDKPTLNIDQKIHADLRWFIPQFLNKLKNYTTPIAHSSYLAWCKERVKKYPVVLPEYSHKNNCLNPYIFVDNLLRNLDSNAAIVTANGAACVIAMQTVEIKDGQRLYTNAGDASMGYDLPAAIGACLARNKKTVICIAGDGSIMMNLQELQTIVGYKLPIKIIVLNNSGYLSIKQTQHNYFSDNVFGTGPNDGVTLPNFENLGKAFEINSFKIDSMAKWNTKEVQKAFIDNCPALFEIICDPDQNFAPKLASKKLDDGTMLAPSLENMSPFLPDDEMASNIFKD